MNVCSASKRPHAGRDRDEQQGDDECSAARPSTRCRRITGFFSNFPLRTERVDM
jgi:hypothetical protein